MINLKFLDRALELADRRELLGRNLNKQKVKCGCGSDQIQLVYYFDTPAQWRCRECGYKFEWEPA